MKRERLITLRLTEDEYQRMAPVLMRELVSVSGFVRRCVREYLERMETKPAPRRRTKGGKR